MKSRTDANTPDEIRQVNDQLFFLEKKRWITPEVLQGQEGIETLAHAFVLAGAQSIISTL